MKLNFIELIIKDIKIELNDNELIEENQLFIEQILKTHKFFHLIVLMIIIIKCLKK